MIYKLAKDDRTPGTKLGIAILIGALLAVPLFALYLLNWDRETQADTARESITQGWGGRQRLAGPVLMVPFLGEKTEVVTGKDGQTSRTVTVARALMIAPEKAELATDLAPEVRRRRSIYRAVVYTARTRGSARFVLPADLARLGVPADRLQFNRAELRFGVSDPRGLVGSPQVSMAGRRLPLVSGFGSENVGNGFHAPVDATMLKSAAMAVGFDVALRGNGSLALSPAAGDIGWRVRSSWRNPSFTGGFLPVERGVGDRGFDARWRVGNLALGTDLATVTNRDASGVGAAADMADHQARIDLVTPVDIYDQVNRAVKYGFLFIGFTFAAFLMFDVIGGARVAMPEYLLVGMGLILFFVLLLALAEVIGFAAAYAIASAAIIGLIATYSAAVLRSWTRGGVMAALLAGLYGVLYVLLSLEAFSLLIGAILLFVALAALMYATRRLDWSGVAES